MEITIPFKTSLKRIPFSAPGKELSVAKHQGSTKPEGSSSQSHLSVLSQGLGSVGETPAGPSPALGWQRRWGALSTTGEGIHPSSHSSARGKTNPAGTASSLWERRGCCWMGQRHPNRKVSEKKGSAVLSPAIKAVSENQICVCVFLKTQSFYTLILF